MKNKICVIDTETDSVDPFTCGVVQLACIIIDEKKLEIIPNSEFCVDIRPSEIDNEEYYENRKSTIEWHSKNYNTEPQAIYEKWKRGTLEKLAMDNFVNYLGKYSMWGKNKGKFSMPIMAGHNIYRFDKIIFERLCKKYNYMSGSDMKIFYPTYCLDSMLMAHSWLENVEEVTSLALGSLYEFFGGSTQGSHDALFDVKMSAKIICRFLQLNRSFSNKIKFKGAFSNDNGV